MNNFNVYTIGNGENFQLGSGKREKISISSRNLKQKQERDVTDFSKSSDAGSTEKKRTRAVSEILQEASEKNESNAGYRRILLPESECTQSSTDESDEHPTDSRRPSLYSNVIDVFKSLSANLRRQERREAERKSRSLGSNIVQVKCGKNFAVLLNCKLKDGLELFIFFSRLKN